MHEKLDSGVYYNLNPNSLKNLQIIMDQFHENTIENSEREWLLVGADTPQCCLIRRLLKQNSCQYDWVSLVSKGGYLNMNLLKYISKY